MLILQDIKRKMVDEKKEMEEKLKIIVREERESWTSERQQLLEEIKRLSITNWADWADKKLKANLQKAKEEIRWKEEEIGSIHHQLSAAKKKK